MNPIEEITDLLEEDYADDIIFYIGEALQYEYAPENVKFKASYARMGKQLWLAVQYDLHKIICDPRSHEMRFFVDQLVSGDIRNLATALLTVLVSQLSIPVAIGVPITAMVLNLGLKKFCRLRLKRPKLSYSEILSKKRIEMHKFQLSLNKKAIGGTKVHTK